MNRTRNERKLCAVNSGIVAKLLPTILNIDGSTTDDRHLWREGRFRHGSSRFFDPENTHEVQRMRLEQVNSASHNEIQDGIKPPDLDVFDVVTGRAGLRAGTAAGIDGAPSEVYRALPFSLVVRVWQEFRDSYLTRMSADVPSWSQRFFARSPRYISLLRLTISDTLGSRIAWPNCTCEV